MVTEIKITNNEIVDGDRETWITAIYNELVGLTYYPHESRTVGLGYFEVGDMVTLQDTGGNSYLAFITEIEMDVTTGIIEKLKAAIPDVSTTDYDTAGKIGQRIYQAEIQVNKNTGEIDIIAGNVETIVTDIDSLTGAVDANTTDIDGLEGDVTALEQRADSLEISVQGIGGKNLLINSVGLKGTIEEWQELDENGDPLDADNDGTVDQSTAVTQNTESGSAIQLINQFILQTFNTIQDETYTVYCRYKSDDVAVLSVTGSEDITLPSSSGAWLVYKGTFVATGSSTTLRFSNVASGAGSYVILSDIVAKLGDVNGWIQAPNEIYGTNYRFDKDGFSIESLTSAFKSLLDNEKLQVENKDTGVVVMFVSKDSGKITNLTVQDLLTIQRYENAESAVKIIPTATGAMVVVND